MGSEGFRCSGQVCPPGSTTQYPSGLTVAHSWDPALFGEWGTAMGEEFAGKGANVQFGPGVNVARIANGGRSFEYLSGEDPYLGYVLVQPVVKGIQSQGVIANVKHYVRTGSTSLALPCLLRDTLTAVRVRRSRLTTTRRVHCGSAKTSQHRSPAVRRRVLVIATAQVQSSTSRRRWNFTGRLLKVRSKPAC